MFARIAARAPIAAAFAGKRAAPATIRYNSSSSSSHAARMMEMAAQAERPSTFSHPRMSISRPQSLTFLPGATEVAVPVMWVLCGALGYTAWNRMTERTAGQHVEKLLIV